MRQARKSGPTSHEVPPGPSTRPNTWRRGGPRDKANGMAMRSGEGLQRALATLQCRRLVVTHMGDDVLARSADLGIETAEDGKVIDV
jgi:hypothetical protein